VSSHVLSFSPRLWPEPLTRFIKDRPHGAPPPPPHHFLFPPSSPFSRLSEVFPSPLPPPPPISRFLKRHLDLVSGRSLSPPPAPLYYVESPSSSCSPKGDSFDDLFLARRTPPLSRQISSYSVGNQTPELFSAPIWSSPLVAETPSSYPKNHPRIQARDLFVNDDFFLDPPHTSFSCKRTGELLFASTRPSLMLRCDPLQPPDPRFKAVFLIPLL